MKRAARRSVCVVCTAPCLVELDLISGPRSDPVYSLLKHIPPFVMPVTYVAKRHTAWAGAGLGYAWRCCGRWTRERPFLCVCAPWTRVRHTEDGGHCVVSSSGLCMFQCCASEAVLACAKGRLVSTCTPDRRV
jgi:hypothetical protein